MIHLERTSLLSEGGDSNQYSYQVHYIDSEDKLSQLISLEQQLEFTEQRFRRLQNYVDYIRTLYQGSVQDPSAIQVCNLSTSNCFPLDLSSVVNLSSVDDLKNTSFESSDENIKDFNGGGDAIFVKEVSKDIDSVRKKKSAKKKVTVKKSKTPSKKVIEEEPSVRAIEKKLKAELKKSTPKRETNSTYLKPTVSSRMKMMRPLNPNFNFRSIPFVAGKATTRSHNLGIKIQETLSIIKRNTPAEVGRCTDQPSTEPQLPPSRPVTNHFSRMTEEDCGPSRSKCSVTSKPITAVKSSTSLSDSIILDDLNDNAEADGYLKKALLYVQSDFTQTLNEYKSLTTENKPKNTEKIKDLEERLDRKEEVIIAFSKLYNQVISLRRQLEQLEYYKEYKRHRSSSVKSRIVNSYPAVKLTRLLRKIQDFQNKIQGFPDI